MKTLSLFNGLIIVFAISHQQAKAQNKTFLAFDLGPKFEMYEYADNGKSLSTPPFYFSPIYGFTLAQELNKTFVVETGLYVDDYGESYKIQGDAAGFASNAFLAYQIPFRLRASQPLIKDKLFLTAGVGAVLAINSDAGFGSIGLASSFASSTSPGFNDSTRTEYRSVLSEDKKYWLLETSLGFRYDLEDIVTFSLQGSIAQGFKRVNELEVSYWINDQDEQTAQVFTHGNYYSVTVGVHFVLSNLWQKPKI